MLIFLTPKSVGFRPVRVALNTIAAFALYLFAADLWRLAAESTHADARSQTLLRVVAFVLAAVVLTGHASISRRWMPSTRLILAWPVLTIAAAGLAVARVARPDGNDAIPRLI